MTDKATMQKYLERGKNRKKITPVAMNLTGDAGKRVVLSAAKRVISTHHAVIKALANR